MRQVIADDLDVLFSALPATIRESLVKQTSSDELIEIILDLGRLPEARYLNSEAFLSDQEVTAADIDHVVSRIGSFSGDNRAGITRTLHRISAIRNREGQIIGLTCRVGRAVFGTVKIIQNLIETGKSVLLLGPPGIGKTTMLREAARVLADDSKKRVIVVDTSNEIAGDGDIPHWAIGHARRMQVPEPTMQHAVMIEAVENHMPQVIIIDEIGTKLEAEAARTIAERGVQLVGTAHGENLENLMMNPTLSDLVGGIQSVTLSDEEARRRGTQKSILERKAPPTFHILVEIQERYKVAVHPDVSAAVDAVLQGKPCDCEIRWLDENGEMKQEKATKFDEDKPKAKLADDRIKGPRLYLFGINMSKLEDAAVEKNIAIQIADSLSNTDILLTTKNHFRRKSQKIRDAEAANIPIYAVKTNSPSQLKQFLDSVCGTVSRDSENGSHANGQRQDSEQQKKSRSDIEAHNTYIRNLQQLLEAPNRSPQSGNGKPSQRK